MTVKQLVRSIEKAARAAERNAARAERQAAIDYQAYLKQQQQAHAAGRVQAEEGYLRWLVSQHHHGSPFINWHQISHSGPPPQPAPTHAMEVAAQAALSQYKPSLTDRLLNKVDSQRAKLQQSVVNARAWDEKMHADAVQQYWQAYQEWSASVQLAHRIAAYDTNAYLEVLQSCDVPNTFNSLGGSVTITAIEPNLVAFQLVAQPDRVVPPRKLSLTKNGGLAEKNRSASEYWLLVQDHLCSCSIRLACDSFNLLPVHRTIVNVGQAHHSSVTGHPVVSTLIAVHFTRAALGQINIFRIDPSDSLQNFDHRMKFQKSKGFTPVDPIAPEEQWVTTR